MKSADSGAGLNRILDTIGQRPQRFFFIVLLLAGFWFSIVSIIVALCFTLILRSLSYRVLLVMVLFALCLMIGAWWANDVTVQSIHRQGVLLSSALRRGDTHYLAVPYFWFSVVPYSLLMATLMSLTLKWSMHLQHELKRVREGRLASRHHFISTREMQQALGRLKGAATSEGTILGINRQDGRSVILKDQDANLHTLAIGTTGSGKTTAIANIVESAIVRNYPVFYVDGKGDINLANAIGRLAKTHQIPFYLFSMKGVSLKYNPIALGGYTSKKDRLIELRTWSEDHYRKLAEGYLQTVFKLLDQRELNVDLKTLSRYLEPEALYHLARQRQDKAMVDSISALEPAYSQISSLVREIRNIVDSEIGHLFDTSAGEVIALEQVLKEGSVVYFCLQPLAFPAYAETLGKLIINDMKSLLATQLDRNSPRKLFSVFDEFSVFAGDQIVHLINQGRGAGMHAVLATQSLSDIQRKGGDALLGQVLNNTNNYIIQRQNYSEDAEILANIIGTQSTFEVTSQLSASINGADMRTVRQTREFIIHPDDIKRLECGEAVFVNKQKFQVQRIQTRKGVIL